MRWAKRKRITYENEWKPHYCLKNFNPQSRRAARYCSKICCVCVRARGAHALREIDENFYNNHNNNTKRNKTGIPSLREKWTKKSCEIRGFKPLKSIFEREICQTLICTVALTEIYEIRLEHVWILRLSKSNFFGRLIHLTTRMSLSVSNARMRLFNTAAMCDAV